MPQKPLDPRVKDWYARTKPDRQAASDAQNNANKSPVNGGSNIGVADPDGHDHTKKN